MEVSHVVKSYENKKILDDITFNVSSNEIYCLLGKNGAGKSTLLSIIAQIIPQDSGTIKIRGKKCNRNDVLIKEKIGIVGQFDFLIDELTGYQYLELQCLLYKVPASIARERIHTLVEFFFDDFTDIHKYIRCFSTGMRKKINIISALIHAPEILLLDEPFSNLDPIAAQKLVLLLKKFAEKTDNMVMLSSHDLFYVDRCATNIGVLDNGKIVFDGSKEAFTKNNSHKVDESLLNLIITQEISLTTINWLY